MARLKIEVVFACCEAQEVIVVEMPAGATVRDAMQASGLAGRLPEIAAGRAPVGIFGRSVKPETPLKDGDRVEIYRPLRADPKEARRAKATARRRAKR